MKLATQYDKDIVEAAGIRSEFYRANESCFAELLCGHREVDARIQELMKRAFAAQAIREILTENPNKQESILSVIHSQCGQERLLLK